MAKKLKYEKAILSFLEDYADITPANWKEAVNQVIVDHKGGHYQLVRLGWMGDEYVHYVLFHLDLIDSKVWVQQNRTDLPIIDELEYWGIPEKDIILPEWERRKAVMAA